MNPILPKLLASVKIPAWVAAGCAGTVVVQHYTTSSSSSWDEKAARGKESSGQGIKFEVSQLSKQLEEKEQSLKTWEEMLAKQAADLNERLAAASVPVQTTTVKTVAETKLDEPVIDETPFGEEDPKNGKSKQSKSTWRGIAKQAAEALTVDIPRRPAVFDGGGTPAVAFPPTTDVVTVKETSDISEKFEAELRAKDRALEVLKEQREALNTEKNALEAELEEKDRQLKELNTSNKDLRWKLVETGEKLSKAEEESERLGLVLNAANGAYRDVWKKMAMLPETESYAVCRFEKKEASKLWNFFPPLKWLFDACLNNRCEALRADIARDQKVDLREFEACYTIVPAALYIYAVTGLKGSLVQDGKDYYSVRSQPEGLLGWLLCCCRKKQGTEISKRKYKEFVADVVSKENGQGPKIRKLHDVLSPKENKIFKAKKNAIRTDEWTLLAAEDKDGYSFKELFRYIFCSRKRVDKTCRLEHEEVEGTSEELKVSSKIPELFEEQTAFWQIRDKECTPFEVSDAPDNKEAYELHEDGDGCYTSYVFLPCFWLRDGMMKVWSWLEK